jgi:uncharacterized protein YndB with AHSA1/START domain
MSGAGADRAGEARVGEARVSEVRVIAAPRQRLFDLVADPAQHPRIDGSGTVQALPAGGPARLAPGVRFGMSMRMGLPYRTSNRVVEFEEGHRIGWAHFSRAVWRWEFRDVAGGTEVTETFDWSQARVRAFMRRFVPGNRVAMRRSLERLERLALGLALDGDVDPR